MNEMTMETQEMVEQGWVQGWVKVATQKLFNWLCLCELGLSPLETRMFIYHSGFGWEDAQTYRSMVHRKYEDMI